MLQLPRQVGHVQVMERLGEGGMAVVHRGQDRLRPDRSCAIKFLRGEALQDPELVRRFLREGEVLQALSHPALVEVFAHGRAGQVPYILMELLPGGSVKACLGEPPAHLVQRLVPVADALAYAHTHGVIHRDLKPSNLLFSPEGLLKVTDFGVCLWEGDERTRATRSRMVVGTLGYMAPEQHGDPRRVDGRCDVYALGALLFEFVTGQSWAQTQMPPAAVRPGVPVRMSSLLMRALVADPARRLPSMEAFRDELQGWLASAEAVGWGSEPLPGHAPELIEAATVARSKGEPEPVEIRLGAYLDALRSGTVGARRTAADALQAVARPEDEPFLLATLADLPPEMRFAVVGALGRIGSEAALAVLAPLLEDPFVQREAADALSLVAARCGLAEEALARLGQAGLGPPWHWIPRARLGDAIWIEALMAGWTGLSTAQRLQALEAARELPGPLRAGVKSALAASVQREGLGLRSAWEAL